MTEFEREKLDYHPFVHIFLDVSFWIADGRQLSAAQFFQFIFVIKCMFFSAELNVCESENRSGILTTMYYRLVTKWITDSPIA